VRGLKHRTFFQRIDYNSGRLEVQATDVLGPEMTR
jgi:hypothetical protein